MLESVLIGRRCLGRPPYGLSQSERGGKGRTSARHNMTDQSHIGAIAETDSRYGGRVLDAGTRRFTWWKIVAVFALVSVVAVVLYLLVWPASYLGDVRWGPDYDTLILVDTGETLDVTDSTQIVLRGGDTLSLRSMRLPSFPEQTGMFRAKVVYRPYMRADKSSGTTGKATAIHAR